MLKNIVFLFLFSFFVGTAMSGTLDSTITEEQIREFQEWASGSLQWPVYRIPRGRIVVDGIIDETEWQSALPLYTSGERMWNPQSDFNNRGLSDILARWNVVYDSDKVYIACEFFDDVHHEGSGSEPWFYNDAVELTLLYGLNLNEILGSDADITGHTLRLFRRFTETTGLIGVLDGIRFPGELQETGWVLTEPEGSLRLGGIVCCATPSNHPEVVAKFPGAWCMEISIPLSTLLGTSRVSPVTILDGRKFKMGLSFSDDDKVEKPPEDNTIITSTLYRYPRWWGGYTASDDTGRFLFSPVFMLTAPRGTSGSSSLLLDIPEERKIYCGKTRADYETFLEEYTDIATGSSQASFESRLNVRLFPNPVGTAGRILFFVPQAAPVTLSLYDSRGVMRRSFRRFPASAGDNAFDWNGLDDHGVRLAPGLYLLRLQTRQETTTQRIMVIR
ncbi:MAG: hypothetical protein A2293_08165 [Elusimicrobia bacterium RIFOXYB2_FULL_49_7]|nr:MAG: hypothetical protein A2293_08165 [Elusimicrobia bacterium RIFOXYB2_FULL_49_7]